ncbi:MAG: GAF domain-containing protein [Gammaproteobacteria bacterium]
MKLAPDIDALCAVLRAACLADDAVGGMIHLISEDGCRYIAHVDLSDDFLARFASVTVGDGTTISQVLVDRRRVAVRNIAEDEGFAPYREVAAEAGVVAIQSTPVGNGGRQYLYGVLTTCYDRPHHPDASVSEILDACADLAAKIVAANEIEEMIEARKKSSSMSAGSAEMTTAVARATAIVETLLPLCEKAPSLELLEAADEKLGVIVEELARRAHSQGPRPEDVEPIGHIHCA